MSRISVKAFIIRKDKVLLLRPKNLQGSFDGWDGPGGHVEVGETILDALKREIFEETKIKVGRVYPMKLLYNPINDTEYLIFLCDTTTAKVVLSEEHISYRWVKIESLKEMLKEYLINDLQNIQKIIDKFIGKKFSL